MRNVLPDLDPPTSRICFAPLANIRCASDCRGVSSNVFVKTVHRDDGHPAGVFVLFGE